MHHESLAAGAPPQTIYLGYNDLHLHKNYFHQTQLPGYAATERYGDFNGIKTFLFDRNASKSFGVPPQTLLEKVPEHCWGG